MNLVKETQSMMKWKENKMIVLSIVLIILKVYDVIDWSWFIVLAPLFLEMFAQSLQKGLIKIINGFPEEFKRGITNSKK